MDRKKPQPRRTQATLRGRLLVLPGVPEATGSTGLQQLGLAADRDALLYVPARYRPERPAPLAVMLHGAGGSAQRGLALLQALADDHGVLVLAPASRRQTWDVIMGGFGPDIALLDQALGQVFSRYNVDPARLAIGGFSDGASYALSVGVTNGDLFSHIIAFSPGFMAPAEQRGTPRVFISHGLHDSVLPIDRCSQRIVPELANGGYDVLYREFDGPHTVPPAIALEAVAWFTS